MSASSGVPVGVVQLGWLLAYGEGSPARDVHERSDPDAVSSTS